jgi:hypothetical protein
MKVIVTVTLLVSILGLIFVGLATAQTNEDNCIQVIPYINANLDKVEVLDYTTRGNSAHDSMTLHIQSFTDDPTFITEGFIYLRGINHEDGKFFVMGVGKDNCIKWLNELGDDELDVVELIFELGQGV